MRKYKFIKTYIVEADSQEEAEELFGSAKNPNDYLDNIKQEEIVEKPSMEEILQHYRTGLSEDAQCFVCGRELTGPFTDFNGQIRCIECGTTYQILGSHLKDDFLKEHNLSKEQIAQRYCDCFEYVPLLKLYWQEAKKRIPFGTFISNNPYTQDETDAFYSWVARNADRFEKSYDGFNWDMLKAQYLK